MTCNLRAGKVRRWLMASLLLLLTSAALAQDAPRMTKSVHGYRIALAVQNVLEPAPPGKDARHAPASEHRLRTSVSEEATGRAAPIASIAAHVAEAGYSGGTILLSPAHPGPGEEAPYEGRVRLSTKTSYRILIHATSVRGGRTLEAQFGYRHHH